MKQLKKILKWTGIILLVLILGLVTYILTSWDKTFDGPIPDIKASTDSAVIARGEYLVYGPMHCAECHTDKEGYLQAVKGVKVPLSGGYEFKLPFGTVTSKNITNDKETGIGRYTDGEIARTIRELIKPDGHTMIPFMSFQNMSEDDLIAIISYLRTTEPVKKEIPENTWNFAGKAVLTFFIKPVGPKATPPKAVQPSESAAYGEYLATAISNCNGCHTPFSMKTGKPIGPVFSGGNEFESATLEPGVFMMSPNLTPDPETGRITDWSEETFVKRFREGKLYNESAMPWGPYLSFTDSDLKAIYAYLKTLPPVKNETVAGVIRKES
ncbi:MAG: c-type cytochrome [Chitinophagales bacterium]